MDWYVGQEVVADFRKKHDTTQIYYGVVKEVGVDIVTFFLTKEDGTWSDDITYPKTGNTLKDYFSPKNKLTLEDCM